MKTSKQRKVIVYIATSADGYIARKDGDVDWLNRPRIAGDYGIGAFYRSIDTILWGRKTYELALEFQKAGVPNSAFDTSVKNYVFSRKLGKRFKSGKFVPPPGVEIVDEDIANFTERLRAIPGKNVWMMGGAGIIASFLDAGEIDEFIIHVIPTLIGEGIPLVQPRHRNVPLSLRSVKKFKDGVVRLHYAVGRNVAAKPSKGRKSKTAKRK
jgi:dihydrofolate reductase